MKKINARVILVTLLAAIASAQVFSQSEDRIEKRTRLTYDWNPSFVSNTEITGGPGISLTDAPYALFYFGITSTAGYQFTRNIKAGGGTGLLFHNDGTFIPLFLDARFSLNANEFVPFFSAAGGFTFNLADPDNRTWLFINPSLGVRWVVAERRSASFSVGMMTMSGNLNRNSFINFKLGLELKGK